MPGGRRPVVAVAALGAGTFGFLTTEALPIGLLPQIGTDLDRSLSASGLLVTGYAAVVLVTAVPLTVATRRVPRRPLLGGLLALFAAASVASAAAPTFEALLATRVLTALVQAVFWSVVTPTAAAQFPPERRAHALSALFVGTSLGPVLGLPAVTWIGQHAGWRSAFATVAGLALATCVAVLASLPAVRREHEAGRTADRPDARRYAVLLTVVVLTITGSFATYTYVTAHLIDVAGLPRDALGPVLLAAGLAGVIGAAVTGPLMHRAPRSALLPSLVAMLAAGVLLLGAGRHVPAAVTAFCLIGLASSSFASAVAGRLLVVAPGTTDVASAGTGAAYNAGIGAGSWIGGLLVAGPGVRATAVVTVALVGVALALATAESRSARGLERAQ